jgi:hypothetical protein
MSTIPSRRSSRLTAQQQSTVADKPKPRNTSRSLQDLPSELIELVAKHLRSEPWPPRCPYLCARETSEDPSFSLSNAKANTYADPSWALSCTSKRLRDIVFNGNIERRTRIGYCHQCYHTARAIPQHIRDNVRYVWLLD